MWSEGFDQPLMVNVPIGMLLSVVAHLVDFGLMALHDEITGLSNLMHSSKNSLIKNALFAKV
jgi:hypothetical protein